MADHDDCIWVTSNRQDDRVILWERDPAHPGGECFIGGSGPDFVARTPAVEAVLRSGEAVEIAEPPAKGADGEINKKKPLVGAAAGWVPGADQPGSPGRLGRTMDPDLVPAGAMKAVEQQQTAGPSQLDVPAGAIVPPAPPARESRRS